ncbi:MAG: ABC transporter permease [Actinobacteria bacterium]|nr:ABC transporter permease [Actinomycetota bacterium]
MLGSELRLLFGRARTRAVLAALAGVPVLLAVAVRLSGGPEAGNGPPFLSQVAGNGVFAAVAGLTVVLPFFLPLAVSMVSGDTVAGEAATGTLRALLVRPVGRTRLLAVKGVSAAAFCLAAAAAVAAAGLTAGAVLFPLGRVTTLSGTTLSLGEGTLRTVAAAGVVGMSMMGLAAIGLFVSTLTDSAVAAMAATAVAAIVSQVLDAVPQLSAIHPLLVSHRWGAYAELFRASGGFGPLGGAFLLQAAWVVVFGLAAWGRFTTKDVVS